MIGLAALLLSVGGAVCLLFTLYLALLALLALSGRKARSLPISPTPISLTVVIPAHDEAGIIERCVQSIVAAEYPRRLLKVIVIADNCSDSTAEAAELAGATVLVRTDGQLTGKGHALAWAFDRLLSQSAEVADAFVVVDADSVVDAAFLGQLATAGLKDRVIQGRYGVLSDTHSRNSPLRQAAIDLFNHVRLLGRDRLGLSVPLLGNGMLFHRSVLEQHPWSSFGKVEDLEYWLQLAKSGLSVRYCQHAVVRAPLAPSSRAASLQRMRWEGGRFALLLREWRTLVLQGGRQPSLLVCLLELATPPLTVLATLVAGGAVVAVTSSLLLSFPGYPGLLWLAAAACLAVYVLGGFKAAGLRLSGYGALLQTPAYAVWKLAVYGRLLIGGNTPEWVRTERHAS